MRTLVRPPLTRGSVSTVGRVEDRVIDYGVLFDLGDLAAFENQELIPL